VRARNTGFTIVELLIVIVVIAVLAMISIVAYTNITQKANNAAIISAANQTLKAIQAYIAAKDDYPTKTEVCVTVDSGCVKSNGGSVASNSSFNTAMAGVAKPPTSVPSSGTTAYGIYTNYSSVRTFNGEPRPLIFIYFLQGTNQQCGLSDITDGYSNSMKSSSTGYTTGDIDGSKTLCIVSVPAP